jgi:hypothetical protein
VNIQNFGLADEAADSYEMNVYVNDKLIATGKAVAIPMNHRLEDAGTQLSASVRYPKVGTFPVYIEVKAGDYSVKTAAVDVTFAEEVASSNADMAADGTTADVPLNLNYKNSESVTLYNAEALSSIGLVNGSKICAIHKHLPICRMQQAVKMLYNRRFSRACMSGNRRNLSLIKRKADIL